MNYKKYFSVVQKANLHFSKATGSKTDESRKFAGAGFESQSREILLNLTKSFVQEFKGDK